MGRLDLGIFAPLFMSLPLPLKSLPALPFVLLLGAAFFAPAQAGLTLCNPSDDSLAVALANGRTVTGWFVFEGQGCKQVVETDLTDRPVQISVVANTVSGESVLGGDYFYCVLWLRKFSTAREDPCQGRSRRLLGFFTVPTEGLEDLTYILPKDRFGSRIPSTKLKLKFFGRWKPQVEFRSGDRSRIDLSNFRGKWVLLLFWADWCPPCIDALIKLDGLRKSLGGEKFTVVAVHSTDSDSQRKASGIFRDKAIEAIGLYFEDASYKSPKSLARHIGEIESNGIPSLTILDPEGRMIASHDGDLSKELMTFLAKLFGAK